MATIKIFLGNPVMGWGPQISYLDNFDDKEKGEILIFNLYSAQSESESLPKQTWWCLSKFTLSLLPQISYLDNFDDKEKGEGKGREDKNQSAQSEQVRKESRSWFGEFIM